MIIVAAAKDETSEETAALSAESVATKSVSIAPPPPMQTLPVQFESNETPFYNLTGLPIFNRVASATVYVNGELLRLSKETSIESIATSLAVLKPSFVHGLLVKNSASKEFGQIFDRTLNRY